MLRDYTALMASLVSSGVGAELMIGKLGLSGIKALLARGGSSIFGTSIGNIVLGEHSIESYRDSFFIDLAFGAFSKYLFKFKKYLDTRGIFKNFEEFRAGTKGMFKGKTHMKDRGDTWKLYQKLVRSIYGDTL